MADMVNTTMNLRVPLAISAALPSSQGRFCVMEIVTADLTSRPVNRISSTATQRNI
jgi:hypothetical protein